MSVSARAPTTCVGDKLSGPHTTTRGFIRTFFWSRFDHAPTWETPHPSARSWAQDRMTFLSALSLLNHKKDLIPTHNGFRLGLDLVLNENIFGLFLHCQLQMSLCHSPACHSLVRERPSHHLPQNKQTKGNKKLTLRLCLRD